ncbi:MAG: hypothetical protein ACOCWZ_09255 [Spirochaetota bacterium]
MNNFVDFVVDMMNDSDKAKEFLSKLDKMTKDDLLEWFKANNYDVTAEDCEKLINNKIKMEDLKDNTIKASY